MSKTALIIAGMHRSGSSALAGTMSKMGLNLGYTLIYRTADNAKGYYENTLVNNLNEKILMDYGYSWDSMELFQWEIDQKVIEKYGSEIENIIVEEFHKESPILIKDPRLSYLLPIWGYHLTRLGYDVKVLIPLRNPYAVVKSIMQRDGFSLFKSSFLQAAHLVMSEYNSASYRRSRTSYETLLDKKSAYALSLLSDLEVSVPVGIEISRERIERFLDRDLDHAQGDSTSKMLPAFLNEIYAQISSLESAPNRVASEMQVLRNQLERTIAADIIYKVEVGLDKEHSKAKKELQRLRNDIETLNSRILNLSEEIEKKVNLEMVYESLQNMLTENDERQGKLISDMRNLFLRNTSGLKDFVESGDKMLHDRLKEIQSYVIESKTSFSESEAKILEGQKRMSLSSLQGENMILQELGGLKQKISYVYDDAKRKEAKETTKRVEKWFRHSFTTFLGLVGVILRSPVQSLLHFRPSKIAVLFRAMRKEPPSQIISNFVALISGRRPVHFADMTEQNSVAYHIESAHVAEGKLSVSGWVTYAGGIKTLQVKLNNKLYDVEYGYERDDVSVLYASYNGSRYSGFSAALPYVDLQSISLVLKSYQGAEKNVDLYQEIRELISDTNVVRNLSLSEEISFYQNRNSRYFAPYDEKELCQNLNEKVKLIAFYLPQFHAIPENDKWWGENFTEWTNVTQGIPRFKGHYQPRLPGDLGFYDLSDPDVMKRQVEMARNYGLAGFCFHYYWFNGKRLLQKPVDIFLKSDFDFGFCMCWANENWTRRWDGMDEEILMHQDFENWNYLSFVQDLLPYLTDERYIKIGSKHLIIVYRPGLIPEIQEIVKKWREFLCEHDIEPIFACVQGFGLENPSEVGFDIAIEFPPHKLAANLQTKNQYFDFFDTNFEGYVFAYRDLISQAENYTTQSQFGLIRTVFPSWDNEARRKGKGTSVYWGSTPELYGYWLKNSCYYALDNPIEGESFVFINAWNEWAEGAYLEPDRHFGYRYLETTYQTLQQIFRKPDRKKIILVGHDAHRHGAQLNALSMCKILKQQFGYDLQIILLEGGDLIPDYERISKTHILEDLDITSQRRLIRDLKSLGYGKAICNTVVTGKFLSELSKVRIRCISLVHELPELIKDNKFEDRVQLIAENADKIIFAAKTVKSGFNSLLLSPKKDLIKEVILPQGVYSIDFNNIDKIETGLLRMKLSLKPEDILIGSVGFGDRRKGFDLFMDVYRTLVKDRPNVHFIWIGDLHHEMEKASKSLESGRNNFHTLSFQKNIIPLMKDLDLFVLTSREDPFPTAALEALALEVPVVAFRKSGGIEELNEKQFCIELAEYLDVLDMATKIVRLLDDPGTKGKLANTGANLMRESFQFDEYVFQLTRILDPNLKKVSVVVPNYNYERYLEERMTSIWQQDYPIFEIIFLDDNSSDNSVSRIQELQSKYGRTVDLRKNQSNSGSVFKQWFVGIESARGDYIWIAEADDSSKPEFISTLLDFYMEDRELGMVYSQSEQIDESGQLLAEDYLYYTDDIDTEYWKSDYISEGKSEILERLSIKNTILNVSSVLWRKITVQNALNSFLDDVLKFRVAGDWYLYVKILEDNKVGFSSNSLNIHRRHSSSQTIKLESRTHLKEIKAIQKLIASAYGDTPERQKKKKAYLRSVTKYLNAISEIN